MNKDDVLMVMGLLEGILEGIEQNPKVLKRFAKLIYNAKVNLVEAGFTESEAFELIKATVGKK